MAARRPSDKPARFVPRVVPAGDRAQMLELAEELDDDANRRAQWIAARLRAARLDGVVDIVPAIVTVTVHFAAGTASEASERRSRITEALTTTLASAGQADQGAVRTVEIPVCYEAPFAADLAEIANATGLAPEEVVRRHLDSDHRVLMIGFAPGFPYIGGLDAALAVPRRATPRARVEAGSVAIANGQTAIYPFATPGGWNVVGRTPFALFDPAREPPSLLAAGDRVRFVAVSAEEFERMGTRRS